MNNYKGKLHFNYRFYYNILKYNKSEISDMLLQLKEKIDNCDNENEKHILVEEYELLLERYDELV